MDKLKLDDRVIGKTPIKKFRFTDEKPPEWES